MPLEHVTGNGSATNPVGSCSSAQVTPQPGAPSSLGLTAAKGSAPLWSARTGPVMTVSGSEGLSVKGECLLAFATSDGHELWRWSDSGHPFIGGAVATDTTVVVATGASVGTAPAAVFPVTTHLSGLDASNGHELWSRTLPEDGQSIPAVFAGSTLVVSLADGTVLGIQPTTGSTVWSDKPPASCHLGTISAPGVNAAVVLGGTTATVEYLCATATSVSDPHDGMAVGLDPANGATEWTFRPGGWVPNYQATIASSDGTIALFGSGTSGIKGPSFRWDLGPKAYNSYEVIGVDEAAGRPLWKMTGVPVDTAVYSGSNQLCVGSQFGVSCRAARTGTQIFEWQPPVVPTQGANGGMGPAAVALADVLYLVAPTQAASQINPELTTQRSAPGTFRLLAIDMANGNLGLSIPLPAYYGGSNGVVVSVMTPPRVQAAGPGIVLVSPQSHETDVTEAFKTA